MKRPDGSPMNKQERRRWAHGMVAAQIRNLIMDGVPNSEVRKVWEQALERHLKWANLTLDEL